MTALLSVRDLSKSYGARKVLDDVGFDIAAGEIAALIGANGAGKSTLFGILGGAIAADGGSALLGGRAILGLGPERVAGLGVGRTFQTSQPYRALGVRESLMLIEAAAEPAWRRLLVPLGQRPRARAEAALDEVGLLPLADATAAALSYGDAKRLELAMALIRAPRLLLMDEPTAGMAPGERVRFMELVRDRAARRGMTVLFTEHDMATVFGFAERLLVLDRGRLIADGAPAAVRENPEVRRAYLGAAPPTNAL